MTQATATLAEPGLDPSRARRERLAYEGGLTERELQVVRCMSHGLTNDEIGRELSLSTHTAKTHACRVFRKLGARDRAHAVAIAFRKGWLA